MERKAFNLIMEDLDKELTSQKFTKGKILDYDSTKSVEFRGEAIIYKLEYNKVSKSFRLLTCGITDEDKPDDNSLKCMSTWAFDSQEDDMRYAEDISRDFVETVSASKRKEIVKKSKKRKKSDDGNVDPLFFMNRLVNVFPELKEEIKFEKDNYEYFRGVTFTKEKVLPKLSSLLESNNESMKKKFCKIISEMYIAGDLDVRGIITFIILNSIEDEKIKQNVSEMLSQELKKAWGYSEKLKGKKIKPEKKKVKKSFMSKVLEAQ